MLKGNTKYIADYLRKIIEILYKNLSVKLKGKKPSGLKKLSADSLWNDHVKEIVDTKYHADLKNILDLSNPAVSGHDGNT